MDEEVIKRHESYGMISLVRRSGTTRLFGSGVEHSSCIALKISTAYQRRRLHRDWYSDEQRVVEIELSPAQFAGLLTNMNTQGVPCTIRYVKGEGYKESPPVENKKRELVHETTEYTKNLKKQFEKLRDAAEVAITGKAKKADKEALRSELLHMGYAVDSNLKFLHQSNMQTLEGMVAQAAMEVDATVNGIIQSAGLEAIKDKIFIGFDESMMLEEPEGQPPTREEER